LFLSKEKKFTVRKNWNILKIKKKRKKKMFVFSRIIFFITLVVAVSAHMVRFEKLEILSQSWVVTQTQQNIR
jgi:hypothetical protein